ncbi:tRNA1(Val) (adenine(37)-N6)-methyltransferase [Rheinheimera maricola]|uniref:tRNA1(Val) (adenine(37)-N6)-methyltransferase n=1 Tax=Rheinheimera maricola TaxID=2793282 RepID=A0ABS7X6Y7_9GAMM|nr:methyltransferase [Rheinheimera maricola]MBZ9611091.1 methyltransferase [Rheinheimera maricola]
MSAGFQCKKFYVAHDQCAMKVGTDGLLLGAFAPLPPAGSAILDIGAGSGLISLMLAQRSNGANVIDAVELDSAAASQAAANVAASPWPNAVQLIKGDILTYHSDKRYRLIVSNPPFFQQALPAQDARRHQARHTDSLPFAALLQKAATLISAEGVLALILPPTAAAEVMLLATGTGWVLQQQCAVYSKPGKQQRVLLCLNRQQDTLPRFSELLIHDATGAYSAAYQQLLAAFYLKFPEPEEDISHAQQPL